jgi:DNA (cytosine-5)-methyltransferase 1
LRTKHGRGRIRSRENRRRASRAATLPPTSPHSWQWIGPERDIQRCHHPALSVYFRMTSTRARRSGAKVYALRDHLAARPVAVDLFSGVGGLALGLEQAGFFVSHSVEIEEVTGRYAQYNFPHSRVLHGDLRGDVKRFGREVFDETSERRVEPVLVAGGPPCQGFSIAGRKDADDPLNELVLEFARVVLELRPMAFLMENVPGIKTSNSPSLARAIRRLEKEYSMTEPTTLDAWRFGVPQMRRRVFLIGIRSDLRILPSLPEPTHYRPTEDPNLLLRQTPTSWDAISDIPEADHFLELISGDSVRYNVAPQNDFQRAMREELRSPDDYAIRVAWDKTLCTNLRRTQHGDNLLKRLMALGFGKADKMSGIRRLDPKDISTTIRAGTTESRGSWSAPRPLHPFSHRVLTTRECARIQTFPDWMRFHPVKWHGNRMVGNAVPPTLGAAVGRHILSTLGISAPKVSIPAVSRDESLIRADIEAAIASKYEHRNISQNVVSWSPRHRVGRKNG